MHDVVVPPLPLCDAGACRGVMRSEALAGEGGGGGDAVPRVMYEGSATSGRRSGSRRVHLCKDDTRSSAVALVA